MKSVNIFYKNGDIKQSVKFLNNQAVSNKLFLDGKIFNLYNLYMSNVTGLINTVMDLDTSFMGCDYLKLSEENYYCSLNDFLIFFKPIIFSGISDKIFNLNT